MLGLCSSSLHVGIANTLVHFCCNLSSLCHRLLGLELASAVRYAKAICSISEFVIVVE